MFFIIAPLCAAGSLFTLICFITTSSYGHLPGTMLARELLSSLIYITVAVALLLMSSNQMDWSIQRGTDQQGMFPVATNHTIGLLTMGGHFPADRLCANKKVLRKTCQDVLCATEVYSIVHSLISIRLVCAPLAMSTLPSLISNY